MNGTGCQLCDGGTGPFLIEPQVPLPGDRGMPTPFSATSADSGRLHVVTVAGRLPYLHLVEHLPPGTPRGTPRHEWRIPVSRADLEARTVTPHLLAHVYAAGGAPAIRMVLRMTSEGTHPAQAVTAALGSLSLTMTR